MKIKNSLSTYFFGVSLGLSASLLPDNNVEAAPQDNTIRSASKYQREHKISKEYLEALGGNTKLRTVERGRLLYQYPHFYNMSKVMLYVGANAGENILKGYQNRVSRENKRDIATILSSSIPIYSQLQAFSDLKHSKPENFSVSYGPKDYDLHAHYGLHTPHGKTNGAYQDYLLTPDGREELKRVSYFSSELGKLSEQKYLDGFEQQKEAFSKIFGVSNADANRFIKLYDQAIKELPAGEIFQAEDLFILSNDQIASKSKSDRPQNNVQNIQQRYQELPAEDKLKVSNSKIPPSEKIEILGISPEDYLALVEEKTKQTRLYNLGQDMKEFRGNLYGATSIISLIDPHAADTINKMGRAYASIYEAIEEMKINEQFDLKNLGSLANGVGIVLTLMQQNSGPSADEVIIEMLEQVLKNQMTIIKEIEKLGQKQGVLEEDISYMISLSKQEHKETMQKLSEINTHLGRIEHRFYSSMSYTRELFEDDHLINLKTKTETIIGHFLDTASPGFDSIMECKRERNSCSREAKVKQNELFNHLNLIESYASNPEVYRGRIFSSVKPLIETPIEDWGKVYGNYHASMKTDLMEDISLWMNKEYNGDSSRARSIYARYSKVGQVNTEVYKNIIRPDLLINHLLPEFLKTAFFYNKFDLLTQKSDVMKHQFNAINAAAMESRYAVGLARALLEKYGQKVHQHMLDHLQFEPLAEIPNYGSLSDFILSHLSDGPFERDFSVNEIIQMFDKSEFEDITSLKSMGLVNLGIHYGLWTIAQNTTDLEDAHFQYKVSRNNSTFTLNGTLRQKRHAQYLKLTADAKSMLSKGQNKFPEKLVELKVIYSVHVAEKDADYKLHNLDRNNFGIWLYDSFLVRISDAVAPGPQYFKMTDPEYVGDKPTEKPAISEDNVAIISYLLAYKIEENIKKWIAGFGDKVRKNPTVHEDFIKWEKARNALIWHIEYGYGQCLSTAKNLNLLRLVYESAGRANYNNVLDHSSLSDFLSASKHSSNTYIVSFPKLPARKMNEKEIARRKTMSKLFGSSPILRGYSYNEKEENYMLPERINPIESTKNRWGDLYGQFLEVGELPRVPEASLMSGCDYGPGNISTGKVLIDMLPK